VLLVRLAAADLLLHPAPRVVLGDAPDVARGRLLGGGPLHRRLDLLLGGAPLRLDLPAQPVELALELPAGVRLSLLSVASERVCWAAGPGGVLVRTTDGQTWHLVAGPSPAAIVGLVAADAASARVRTADGLTYETRDGGATWQQR
jgi:hypothetical protein